MPARAPDGGPRRPARGRRSVGYARPFALSTNRIKCRQRKQRVWALPRGGKAGRMAAGRRAPSPYRPLLHEARQPPGSRRALMVAAGGFICLASAACLLLTLAAGQPAPQTASAAPQVRHALITDCLQWPRRRAPPSAYCRRRRHRCRWHACLHASLPSALQPNNDIDSFVRVVDGQFVVGPTCKRFLVTGWNQ